MSMQNIGKIINLSPANAPGRARLRITLTCKGRKLPGHEVEYARLVETGDPSLKLLFSLPANAGFAEGSEVTIDIDAQAGMACVRPCERSSGDAGWKLRAPAGPANPAKRTARRFGGTLGFKLSLRPGLLKLLGFDKALRQPGDRYEPEQEILKQGPRIEFVTGEGFADKSAPAPLPYERLGRKDAREAARAALKK